MEGIRRIPARLALLGLLAAGLLVAPPAVAEPALDVTWRPPQVEVLAGSDRVATAIAVSNAGWAQGAEAVILASGQDFPDALAAAALAGATGGPLLLTHRDGLDPRVGDELRRLSPETVYLAGGEAALGPQVADELEESGFEVARLAGRTRYATAFALSAKAVELGADAATVVVTDGTGFADALSASALAAGLGHPLLLVTATTPAGELAEQFDALGGGQALVVGGPAAVPDAVLAQVTVQDRIAGEDRIATSVTAAHHARGRGLEGDPVLASAESFADGLTGGVFAGVARGAPLLLTAKAELSRPVMAWLGAHGPDQVAQLGGRAAVSAMTTCQLGGGHARPWGCIEAELHRQGYHVGSADGRVEQQSTWAVYAFQKVAGLAVNGRFSEAEWRALLLRPTVPMRHPELGPDHLEVDLSRQLLVVYRGGRQAHAFHISTGKPSTPTIRGVYTIYRKLDYRNVSDMYKPIYFYPRYAIHGYPSVPLHPASAGCIRIDDRDQDFLWPKVPIGEQIAIFR